MKNYKLNFLHLCDVAILSQDNKLSVIGIFNAINLSTLPGQLPKATLVANIGLLQESTSDLAFTLQFKAPDGKILPIAEIQQMRPLHNANDLPIEVGFNIELVNFTFEAAGRYMAQVLVGEELVGEVPVEVTSMEQK